MPFEYESSPGGNSLKLEFGRGSMSPFREIAIQPLEGQNRPTAIVARKRHKTARFQADANRPRDGAEQLGSGTQAHGQI